MLEYTIVMKACLLFVLLETEILANVILSWLQKFYKEKGEGKERKRKEENLKHL